MGRKPKNPPMTKAEMIEAGKQRRSTRVYKAETDSLKDESISKSVRNAINDIKRADGRKRIDLNDTVTVKAVVECYLESCAITSTLPSMTGIALALGFTRERIYGYMKKQDTETSLFLHQVHDRMADILSENALRNNSNAIVSIFLLKSMFGYQDTTTIQLLDNSPNTELSVEDIAQRAGLLSD